MLTVQTWLCNISRSDSPIWEPDIPSRPLESQDHFYRLQYVLCTTKHCNEMVLSNQKIYHHYRLISNIFRWFIREKCQGPHEILGDTQTFIFANLFFRLCLVICKMFFKCKIENILRKGKWWRKNRQLGHSFNPEH